MGHPCFADQARLILTTFQDKIYRRYNSHWDRF